MFDHCLYFNTNALARLVDREWSQAFRPFDLTPPQAFLLRMVIARPGLLLSELAEALTIARPTATRLVDGLVARKLLERRAVEGDGRQAAVYPTGTAQALRPALEKASGEVTRRIQQQVGEDVFARTVAHVRAISTVLK